MKKYHALLRTENGNGEHYVVYTRAFNLEQATKKINKKAKKQGSKVLDLDVVGTVYFIKVDYHNGLKGTIKRGSLGRLILDKDVDNFSLCLCGHDDYKFRDLKQPYGRLIKKLWRAWNRMNSNRMTIEIISSFESEIIELRA